MFRNRKSSLALPAIAASVCLTFTSAPSGAQPDHAVSPVAIPAPRDPVLRRELAARTDSMLAAFRRNDVQGIARMFADDATILGPAGVRVHGRAAIDRFWQERPRPAAWVIETLDAGGSRDAPWQYARSIRTTTANGVSTESITTFVLVWKRDATGVLRIFLDLYT